jgi:thiosulfate/3-mercaptopyruvate sulfurtransferase
MTVTLKRIALPAIALCTMLTMATTAHAWGDKELESEKLAVTFYGEVARGGYKIVKTDELKHWLDQKKPLLLIDTMPYTKTVTRKITFPGAVQMEFPIPEMTSIDEKTKANLIKLLGVDKDRLIVFYCGFTKCTRSHNGAMWATKLGYKNVYRHPGGIKAWIEADYPVGTVK